MGPYPQHHQILCLWRSRSAAQPPTCPQRTDPLLFVKPSTSTDANLPFYYDYSDCSDTRGYELTQSLHYVYT